MELKDKLILFLVGLVALLLLVGVGALAWQRHQSDKVRLELQNQLAQQAKTLEVLPGLYEKLTLQTQDVQNMANQNKELSAQLGKEHAQLLSATQAVVTWKKAYEGLASASQSQVPPQPGSQSASDRTRVDFKEDFGGGYIGVSGYTLTSPPEAYLKIEQLRPLKLTAAIAQLKDQSWKTYVTSSEENVQVDIAVSAVNPYLEEPKWYEKLALRGDLGVGVTDAGAGVLLGLGATFELGRFDVGPGAWMTITNRVDKYLGVMVGFHPFQR